MQFMAMGITIMPSPAEIAQVQTIYEVIISKVFVLTLTKIKAENVLFQRVLGIQQGSRMLILPT